jgi:hypothetical protein
VVSSKKYVFIEYGRPGLPSPRFREVALAYGFAVKVADAAL